MNLAIAAVLKPYCGRRPRRPGAAGRVVEQQSEQRPLRLPQQEQPEQQEQQQWVSCGLPHFLPCRQCHGSARHRVTASPSVGLTKCGPHQVRMRMRGRGTNKWRGLSAPPGGQFPWETSHRDAWPVPCGLTTGIGRISNSHAPSGSSLSERWGVAILCSLTPLRANVTLHGTPS